MDPAPMGQLEGDAAGKCRGWGVPGERQHQPVPVLEDDSASHIHEDDNPMPREWHHKPLGRETEA